MMPPIGFLGPKVAAAAFVSMTTVAISTPPASFTLAAPAGLASGDLLVMFYLGTNGSLTNSAISARPAGFTNQLEQTNTFSSDFRAVCDTKIAGGAEPGSYTWTVGGAAVQRLAVLLAYRPVNATQLDATGFDNPVGSASTTHTQSSMTTLTPQTRLIYCWMENSGSPFVTVATPPAGMTQRAFVNTPSDKGLIVYDQVQAAAGATGTRTLVYSVFGSGIGLRVAVRAA